MVGIQYVPDLLHLILIAMHPGAEARMVEVGDRALRAAVRRQIGSKPQLLRDVSGAGAAGGRAGIGRCREHGESWWILRELRRPAGVDLGRAVDHDDVPAAEVIAVV